MWQLSHLFATFFFCISSKWTAFFSSNHGQYIWNWSNFADLRQDDAKKGLFKTEHNLNFNNINDDNYDGIDEKGSKT